MNFIDARLNCIKGIPIDSVCLKPLSDLGFPVDAPEQPELSHDRYWNNFYYKISESPFSVVGSVEKMYVRYILDGTDKETAFGNTLLVLQEFGISADELIVGLRCGCVYDLSESDVKTLFDEFICIIQMLLPRQLSDLYYSFDIQPNPAHFVFFDLAAEKLNIERYSNYNKNNYGQFIKYPQEGIKRKIDSGESFQKIYQETCATKQMVLDAWSDICTNRSSANNRVYHLRKIEYALFKLSRKFKYAIENLNGQTVLFRVYDSNNQRTLTIAYLPQECFCSGYDYDKTCSVIAQLGQTLVIDYDEVERNRYISSVIRAAIEDEEVIENHRLSRKAYFTYGRALEDCEWNYDAICNARLCGCFSCLSVFDASEVTDWNIEDSACCPYCGELTVIADSQGYQLSKEFLNEVKRYAEWNDEEFEDDEGLR